MAKQEFFTFSIKSDPPIIDSTNVGKNSFPRIYWSSDIFSFYPYQETYMNDRMGLITDDIFFVEGLKFTIMIGRESQKEYLEHTYCWSENQMNNISLGKHVSGDNVFLFLSYYYMMDVPQSRIWADKTASDVVAEIIDKDFELRDSKKIFIEPTEGTDTWYQFNTKDKLFITMLSENCVSATYPKSPYVTFINNKGEFYFQTIAKLFSQKSLFTFELRVDETSSLDPLVIQSYDLLFGGLPCNKDLYIVDYYTVNDSGAYVKATSKIQDHFKKKESDAILIGADYQTELINKKVVGKIEYLGIAEDTADKSRLQGMINSQHIDAMLSYRMTIVIHFFPQLTTGKLITLAINSVQDKNQTANELSGDWLIIKDEVLYDKDGQASQKLLLAKSGININSNHHFKGQFLG